jgi:hypothetical protein
MNLIILSDFMKALNITKYYTKNDYFSRHI